MGRTAEFVKTKPVGPVFRESMGPRLQPSVTSLDDEGHL